MGSSRLLLLHRHRRQQQGHVGLCWLTGERLLGEIRHCSGRPTILLPLRNWLEQLVEVGQGPSIDLKASFTLEAAALSQRPRDYSEKRRVCWLVLRLVTSVPTCAETAFRGG